MTFPCARVLMCSALSASLTLAPVFPALADDVSDALQQALDAYAAGNLAGTATALTLATQALGVLQTGLLEALLPPAPDGWTRSLTEDFSQGFGAMGGGAGAEARYDSADGSSSFTISLVADNPMVSAMSGMLGNAQMMAMMGKVEMVGDQPVLDADGTLQALVGARVLFQAQGADTSVMMPLVQGMDFAKIATFDAK